MTFDNTKYSHLTDDEVVRLALYGPTPVSELEETLARRLMDTLEELDNLRESASLLTLALREYGVYADVEHKVVN